MEQEGRPTGHSVVPWKNKAPILAIGKTACPAPPPSKPTASHTVSSRPGLAVEEVIHGNDDPHPFVGVRLGIGGVPSPTFP